MWHVDRPNISALDSFNTCISRIRDLTLKKGMEAIRPQITHAEKAFDTAASTNDIHLIQPANNVGSVSAGELKKLYDNRMARAGSPGRDIYDQLMIAATNDRCPLCGHRNVSTLDHSLPKSRYPSLAVTPINLVPCCSDCNKDKGSNVPQDRANAFLNAYYDDIEDDFWLFAEIVKSTPAGIRFFVKPHDGWDPVMSTRVQNQFRELKLAKLYASQGGQQLLSMRGALKEIYQAAGADAVRKDLLRSYRSCIQVRVNSWQGSLYRAAAESDWYCGGGFTLR